MPKLDLPSNKRLTLNEKNGSEYMQQPQPISKEIPSNISTRSNTIQKHHDNIESDNVILVNSKISQQRPDQARAYSDPYEHTNKNDNKNSNNNNNNSNNETIANKSMNQLNTYRRWKKVKQLARNGLNTSLQHNINKNRNKKSKYKDDDGDSQTNEKYKKGTSLMRQLEINRAPISLLALSFQKDEKNLPRIQILASLLDIKVIKKKASTKKANSSSQNDNSFYIIVQYGNIQWTIKRRYWDFVKLHYSYYGKEFNYSIKRPTEFPVFPKIMLQKTYKQMNIQKNDIRQVLQKKRQTTCISLNIPHQIHQVKDSQQQQQHDQHSIHSDSGVYNRNKNNDDDDHDHEQKMLTNEMKNKDDVDVASDDIIVRKEMDHIFKLPNNEASSSKSPKNKQLDSNNFNGYDDSFVEKQLENYLNQLIAFTFTGGSINKLCKFLEISTLGIHLKAKQPNLCHRKEGYLMILKRSDREPPRRSKWLIKCGCFGNNLDKNINSRLKWFIIQDNCIICVHHPHEMEIYDVFLIDNKLQVQREYSNQLITKMIKKTSNFSLGRSTLHLQGTHGSLILYSRSVQQAIQFEKVLLKAIQNSSRCRPNQRFNSFAPIRTDCPTTWFVDGKDYFWNISVALDNAKESIYIHDWWLSPELYLRRVPSENSEWRLDKILKKKADQGVKIYIIVYKEVAMTIPLFSHYTKKYLQSLSENIYVQRHPSRILDLFGKQNTLFWAHHEKICIVDGLIAFIGGLDLCFGRWDDAQHKITDDPTDPDNQIWIGKDYSNPRIEDLQALDKPFEDYLDRTRLPRMPWHDVSVRICGSAVSDLEYHFIQRWNYLLRRKTSAPKRPTPLLIPRSNIQPNEYGLDLKNDTRIGSSHSSLNTQVQILRSCSSWSNGINYTEHSIQDAYVELIEKSNHFIYIENQFFITSTKCGTTVIENKIGEALYQRILRAHKEHQKWHAIIILPLTPEFPGKIDVAEGTTIRLIMNCQYLSIGRGPHSILERLRAAGVARTSDYISFYGLRNWGELNGVYTTEQIYIHAKTMIVDDSTVLIGSANINERSMLGIRDSEICACIQDTDTIESTLGGETVKVGRFAHSLRIRLMAEHIGLPVDGLTADRIIDKFITTTNKRKDSMMSDHQDKKKHDTTTTSSLDKSPKMENNESLHHMNSKKNDLDSLSLSSSTSKSKLSSFLFTKIDQQTDDDMQLKQKLNAQTVSEMETLTTITSSNSDQLSYITKLTTTHSIDGELLLYCKKGEAWDTDTDNNGDGFSLAPLPLPLYIETPEGTIGNHDDSDSYDKDDKKEHKNHQPSILKIKSVDPFTRKNKKTEKKYSDTDNEGENIINSKNDDDNDDNDDNDDDDDNNNINDLFHCLRDPLNPTHYHLWHTRARYNTDLFRRCFMVIPENNIRTWATFEDFHKMAKRLLGRSDIYDGVIKVKDDTAMTCDHLITPSQQRGLLLPFIATLLDQIKGHLVIWPLRFMEDEGDDFLFAMDKIAPLEIFN